MSTKIYTGYRMPFISLEHFNNFLQKMRKVLDDEFREIYLNRIYNDLSYHHDRRVLREDYNIPFGEPSEDKSRSTHSIVMDRMTEYMNVDVNSIISYHFNASIFFYENYVYFILFPGQRSYEDLFINLDKNIEYYGYWNNTDPDPSVSDEDWLERERIWDLLIDYSPIVTQGLNFTLINAYSTPYLSIERDHGRLAFPKIEDRIDHVVKAVVRHKYFDEDDADGYDKKYKEWRKTSEAHEFMEKEKLALALILTRKLDLSNI